MTEPLSALVLSEAAKRERHWPGGERNRVIQETLRWAILRGNIERNTKSACLAEDRRKLAMRAATSTS